MNVATLLSHIWYNMVSFHQIAYALELTMDETYRKLRGEDAFTDDEIIKLSSLLNLTPVDRNAIFGR